MALEIRPATEEDLPQMVHLWREMMDYHARCDARFQPKPSPEAERAWTKYVQDTIWTSDEWCVFVAERDGELVGQICGELREAVPVFRSHTYGYVTDIVVDPATRRLGIGRALLDALREWMAERGADHLQLQVLHANPASQAFWRAMGCSDYSDVMWYDFEEQD
jgi:ribosomal protein S18 acetylase RimI-like enzyme